MFSAVYRCALAFFKTVAFCAWLFVGVSGLVAVRHMVNEYDALATLHKEVEDYAVQVRDELGKTRTYLESAQHEVGRLKKRFANLCQVVQQAASDVEQADVTQ